MSKIRNLHLAMAFILCAAVTGGMNSASANISIGFGIPNLYIGINLNTMPALVPIPNYPVYYAPRLRENFFFYDGFYWVYQDSNWYTSTWYDGPWTLVSPYDVPVFILRIPIRYFNSPPMPFRRWHRDSPPHWGAIWGPYWETRRKGWDHWDRRRVPQRAPIPLYQNQYRGNRYPSQPSQKHELEQRHYRYQPQNPTLRQFYNEQRNQNQPRYQNQPRNQNEQRYQNTPQRRDGRMQPQYRDHNRQGNGHNDHNRRQNEGGQYGG